jgi:hypothetical protein
MQCLPIIPRFGWITFARFPLLLALLKSPRNAPYHISRVDLLLRSPKPPAAFLTSGSSAPGCTAWGEYTGDENQHLPCHLDRHPGHDLDLHRIPPARLVFPVRYASLGQNCDEFRAAPHLLSPGAMERVATDTRSVLVVLRLTQALNIFDEGSASGGPACWALKRILGRLVKVNVVFLDQPPPLWNP